jgi:hypothetical protein
VYNADDNNILIAISFFLDFLDMNMFNICIRSRIESRLGTESQESVRHVDKYVTHHKQVPKVTQILGYGFLTTCTVLELLSATNRLSVSGLYNIPLGVLPVPKVMVSVTSFVNPSITDMVPFI